MCLPCVCVCISRLVSPPLNTLVYTFIPVNMWHVRAYQHDSARMRVCLTVCLRVFYDIFYCLFVCVCSGTLYSAVVLLVSIKLRFILGYSSVWYEAQRQDRVSVGRPIKYKQHHVAQKRTGFTKETQPQTNICPENSIFGCYFFFFFLLDANCQSTYTTYTNR